MAKDYFAGERVNWKLITGARTTKKPIGYCCSMLHRGYLTKGLMDKHECLQKNCPNLKKNENHQYWEQRSRTKEIKKAIKKARKAGQSTYEFNGKTYLIK